MSSLKSGIEGSKRERTKVEELMIQIEIDDVTVNRRLFFVVSDLMLYF